MDIEVGDRVRVVHADRTKLRPGDEHYVTGVADFSVMLEGGPGHYMKWRFERVDESRCPKCGCC